MSRTGWDGQDQRLYKKCGGALKLTTQAQAPFFAKLFDVICKHPYGLQAFRDMNGVPTNFCANFEIW